MPEQSQPRPSVSPHQAYTHGNSPNLGNLRHRGPTRPTTIPEGSSVETLRRNSTFSDSVSEARNSIRSSTDGILFPRVAHGNNVELPDDDSHWQSAPLALALLPAIAGLFFKNGSAVITDITLLVLAAIFLNWSVRLPWDWYRSAQGIRQDKYYEAVDIQSELDAKEDKDDLDASDSSPENKKERQRVSTAALAATKELQIHELVALASCFVFPIIGTWLLHTIRSKLSRPSEGLVSNYNLTIFLLASEIRPFSHLLKMVQARTLHLQRVVASSSLDEETNSRIDISKITDLTNRLEELEAHVAAAAAARESETQPSAQSPPQDQESQQSLVSQTSAEIRKGIQPDIEALNRAVRRYEKRTAITAYQTDNRLRGLETQVRDAIALAAAAQRLTMQRRRSVTLILLDWASAAIMVPTQLVMSLTTLPVRVTTQCLRYVKDIVIRSPLKAKSTKGKTPQGRRPPSPRVQKKSSHPDLKSIRKPVLEHHA